MRNKIISKAKEYIGYTEGENNDTVFGDWYGLKNQPWCAMFISYIMNQCGINIRFASCTAGFNKFKEQGIATREHIIPKSGDIIFFVWKQNEATPDHVGIVEYVDGNIVHTIEGNRSDKVQRFSYHKDSWQIYGYATPDYDNLTTTEPITEEPKQDSVIKTITVKVNSVLRIRAGAGTQYDKVGEYTNGTKVDLYEIQGNWGRCKAGWICLDYTAEYNAEQVKGGYVLGLYQVNTPSGLNVRKSPGNGQVLKAYTNGTRFDTYEIQNNWGRTPSRLGMFRLLQINKRILTKRAGTYVSAFFCVF